MVLVVIPVVKNYMAQTSTYQGRQHHVNKKGIQFLQGYAVAFENALHQVPAQGEGNNKHQAVKVDGDESQVYSFRRIPGNLIGKQHRLYRFCGKDTYLQLFSYTSG